MTSIIIHPKVLIQTRVISMILAHLVEKASGLDAVLEETERLGFEAKMKFAACALASSGDVLDASPEIVPDHLFLLGGRNELSEGTRQSAHTALNVRVEQLG